MASNHIEQRETVSINLMPRFSTVLETVTAMLQHIISKVLVPISLQLYVKDIFSI